MNKTDIEQIKNKATKLMNDYKSVLSTEELALSKLSEEEQLNEMFFGDKPTPNELVLMREYFRSFDDEFSACQLSPSEFREPRGFTLEYRELAFRS